MEETSEQRKARLAALKAGKAGVLTVPAAATVTASSAPQVAAGLGEKRKAQVSSSASAPAADERVFEGEDEILDVEDLADEEPDDRCGDGGDGSMCCRLQLTRFLLIVFMCCRCRCCCAGYVCVCCVTVHKRSSSFATINRVTRRWKSRPIF